MILADVLFVVGLFLFIFGIVLVADHIINDRGANR